MRQRFLGRQVLRRIYWGRHMILADSASVSQGLVCKTKFWFGRVVFRSAKVANLSRSERRLSVALKSSAVISCQSGIWETRAIALASMASMLSQWASSSDRPSCEARFRIASTAVPPPTIQTLTGGSGSDSCQSRKSASRLSRWRRLPPILITRIGFTVLPPMKRASEPRRQSLGLLGQLF